jgi:hypothetical protein
VVQVALEQQLVAKVEQVVQVEVLVNLAVLQLITTLLGKETGEVPLFLALSEVEVVARLVLVTTEMAAVKVTEALE